MPGFTTEKRSGLHKQGAKSSGVKVIKDWLQMAVIKKKATVV